MASIRKRQFGKGKVAWQVDYRDLRGKRRHKQFKTRREADQWLVNARTEIADGTHVAASDSITFRQAGDAWIANCRRRKLEDTTINSYQQHLDAHVFPFLGHKKLNELTNVATTTFYEDLLDGKRSQDMVRRVRIDAGAVLNYAKSKGWVGKNVVEDTPFEYSKRDDKRPQMPTIEETQRIIARTKRTWDGWLAFLYVLVFCALRASEIRALAWADIDFGNARLTVSRRADRWGRIGRPKSKAGTRDIPFPPAVGTALREWKPRCPSSGQDLVFPSGKGTVANQANIMNRYFRPMQIEAGVLTEMIEIKSNRKKSANKKAKYGLNALRHFCASLWIEANYDPKRVQTLMGHASIKQTYDTYGYLFELRKADVEALKRTQDRVLMV